jgi:hypothetical protein
MAEERAWDGMTSRCHIGIKLRNLKRHADADDLFRKSGKKSGQG